MLSSLPLPSDLHSACHFIVGSCLSYFFPSSFALEIQWVQWMRSRLFGLSEIPLIVHVQNLSFSCVLLAGSYPPSLLWKILTSCWFLANCLQRSCTNSFTIQNDIYQWRSNSYVGIINDWTGTRFLELLEQMLKQTFFLLFLSAIFALAIATLVRLSSRRSLLPGDLDDPDNATSCVPARISTTRIHDDGFFVCVHL